MIKSSDLVSFRAWDSARNEMFYDVEHGIDLGVHVGFGEILRGWPNGRFTVMQFTGEVDKYGNKIYESDVVLNTSSGRETLHPAQRMGSSFYLADYMDCDGVWHGGMWVQASCMEVVGNIHENPELLCLKLMQIR